MEEVYNDYGCAPVEGNSLYRDVRTKTVYIAEETKEGFNLIDVNTQEPTQLTPPRAASLLKIHPQSYFKALREQEQFIKDKLGLNPQKATGRSLTLECGMVGTEIEEVEFGWNGLENPKHS